MTRVAALILALAGAACANVQDLGSDPRPGARDPGLAVDAGPRAPDEGANVAAPAALSPCPHAAPIEGHACSNVAWCSYRVDPASGLSDQCGCVLGRWTCLRVRDEHRLNPRAIDELPLTTASCVEGARCAEGTRCKVGLERSCVCLSSGRLYCARPVE